MMDPSAASELMDQNHAADQLYEAFALLAGSDPENCSYTKGYVKRQAVFACHTCAQTDMEPAGVCLACANHCHDGHDISELYTKRNFRCDCGNQKFNGFTCKLHPSKDGLNEKNMYNHNYFGRYCSCDRPYPDEDDQVNEEMIQCIVCEDWYHAKHLDSPAMNCDALMEMICVCCMNRASFLWTYAARFAVSPLNEVSSAQGGDDDDDDEDEGKTTNNCDLASTSQCFHLDETQTAGHQMRRVSGVTNQLNADGCVLKELKAKDMKKMREADVFWPYHWRAQLCRCTGCKRMYLESGVTFLLDESDTLLAYEEKGKTESVTCDDVLLSCISSLHHVQQLDIVYQYSELKQELCEFLQQSAEQGKDVTPEVCREFLEEFQMRKRRRLSSEDHCSS